MMQLSGRMRGGPVTNVSVTRLLRSRAGTTAVEFALLALPFLMLIFGVIDFSRLIWTQSAMQFAVEKAARCAAVNTSTCGTLAQIQAYAGSQMLAPGVPVTAFSYTASACGSDVSVTTDFKFILVNLIPSALTLKARSCYPT